MDRQARSTRPGSGYGSWGIGLILLAAALASAQEARSRQDRPATMAVTTPTTHQALAERRIEGDRLITPQGWFALPKVNKPVLPEKVERSFMIPIHGPITSATADAVKRKLLICLAQEAQLIVFDMNTPGGEGAAMMQIAGMILKDVPSIYTVAWVHDEAISAGAIIALACDEIVMTEIGKLGDAMPVLISPGGGGYVPMPPEERSKTESYIRAEVRRLAEQNGYNTALAEAMISMRIEIWLIHNRKTGELRFVNPAEFKEPVAAFPGAATRPALAAPADAEWEYLRTADADWQLLTMTTAEAIENNFVVHVVNNPDDLKRLYHITKDPIVLGDTWSEELVTWLSSAWVTGLLLFVGLLCVYVEMHTPGFGVAGITAIACFAILFGSRFLTGMAQWWEIALFVIGMVLVLVEVFVVPGHGVSGIIGGILILIGLIGIMVPNPPGELPWPQNPLAWASFKQGILAMGLGLICFIVAAALLAKHLPKVPVAGRLMLAPPAPGQVMPVPADSPILGVSPGQVGRVIQTCRPVGKVLIGDNVADAIADGSFLPSGTEVVVLRNEGNRIVVEAKDRRTA